MQFIRSLRQPKGQLFLLSFTTLFAELMIIRWVPATLRLVAYYANLMLISAFLGIGLGALMRRKEWNLFRLFPIVLLVDVVVLFVFRNHVFSATGEFKFFVTQNQGVSNLIILAVVFLLNTAVFVPLGEQTGRLFDGLPKLVAYSWDIFGSLSGTLVFGLFSFFYFSPVVGFVVVGVIFVLVLAKRPRFIDVAALSLTVMVVFISLPTNSVWSPYYYITVESRFANDTIPTPAGQDARTMINPPSYVVRVNQDFYQFHETMNRDRYSSDFPHYQSVDDTYHQYTLPFVLRSSPPESVLIVGSGGGKEAEAALLYGAKSVQAVEIDPVLVALSKRLNPSGIYDHPKVQVEINDARSHFVNSDRQSDLVIFGYLDSQALFSSMANVRLDGFVYTEESFREAWSHVKDDGLLVISFTGVDWVQSKIIKMARMATSIEPLVFLNQATVTVVVPKGPIQAPKQYGAFYRVNPTMLEAAVGPIEISTDDWPFLYLKERRVPQDYRLVMLVLILISFALLGASRQMFFGTQPLHFFFLGVGFLLLQTRSIMNCSLYFGATWLVTTIVIAGILAMILAANLIALRGLIFRRWYYVPLLATIVLLYLVPNDAILNYGMGLRLLWTLVVVPLPILFAGLIFSTTFRHAKLASACFGANLLGATVGGFLEYLSMAYGYRTITLLIMVPYGLSLVTLMFRSKP